MTSSTYKFLQLTVQCNVYELLQLTILYARFFGILIDATQRDPATALSHRAAAQLRCTTTPHKNAAQPHNDTAQPHSDAAAAAAAASA